jgi:hypothetical protein
MLLDIPTKIKMLFVDLHGPSGGRMRTSLKDFDTRLRKHPISRNEKSLFLLRQRQVKSFQARLYYGVWVWGDFALKSEVSRK